MTTNAIRRIQIEPRNARVVLTLVVEEVSTMDRAVHEIRLRSEAMPFFRSWDPDLVLAPPDGLRASPPDSGAGLEWYAAS